MNYKRQIIEKLKELKLTLNWEEIERLESHLVNVAVAAALAELQDMKKEDILFWSDEDKEWAN